MAACASGADSTGLCVDSDSEDGEKNRSGLIVAIVVPVILALVVGIVIGVFVCRKRRQAA